VPHGFGSLLAAGFIVATEAGKEVKIQHQGVKLRRCWHSLCHRPGEVCAQLQLACLPTQHCNVGVLLCRCSDCLQT
jgi:hypothetical protein